MRTKKKMAALLLVMIGLTLICARTSEADTVLNWDWDSCTLEGWTAYMPDIIVSVEDGRDSTCGIGAAVVVGASHVPEIQIEGQTLDPGTLVDGEIDNWFLPMTGVIYVDIDREVPDGWACCVELNIYDEDSLAKFICDRNQGHGSTEDLGNGWYRHHLVNLNYYATDGENAGNFYLAYHGLPPIPEGEPPIVFDNLTIDPAEEPISVGIDIRPSCCPNPLSIVSKGMLPVAILGTNEFDVDNILPDSVVLNGVSAVHHCFKDVATSSEPCVCPDSSGPDGLMDLVLHFPTEDILGTLGGELNDGDEFDLALTGQLGDDTPIEGSDCVVIRDGTLY